MSAAVCPECGTQISPRFLACPACRRLVHKDELERLAREAGAAEAADDPSTALARWRRALELLPPATRQATTIAERVQALSERVDEKPAKDAKRPSWAKGGGLLATIGFLLWKLKTVLLLLLTKGKVLLLGLTKSSTLLTMLLAAGVYWTIWGWKFAVGIVLSIYVHEMGHVVALARYGIRASAPMFIPGFGALVRLKQYPANPREDARVGLAGPIWGLGAAVVTWGLHFLGDWPSLAAIAQFGAWINLFNLLPVWQLDGGRGFRALDRLDRFVVVAAMGAAWYWTRSDLLVLLAVVGALRAFGGQAPPESDRVAFWQFLVLIFALAALTTIPVPGVALP